MKKKIICMMLALGFTFIVASQNSNDAPIVDSQFTSDVSVSKIINVTSSENFTFVIFEYITFRQCENCWISLSSNTILFSNNLKYKIEEWGFINGDDVSDLEFNERYSLNSDRRYLFYMAFPLIPESLNVFSITENISDGFWWKGIHLDKAKSDNHYSQNTPQSSIENSFNMTSSGSCFAISSTGYLATCYHVISEANRIRIRGVNGDFEKTYRAKLVGSDRNNDLAIVKIIDTDFNYISGIPYAITDNRCAVGEDIFVLGYPLRALMGDEIKLTNGVISSQTGYQGDVTSYQISATVQPGNSGCPVLDRNGNVIGVVNARLGVENAAYAVKTENLITLVNSLDRTMNLNIKLPVGKSLVGKTLSEQVQLIKPYIYIIEVE